MQQLVLVMIDRSLMLPPLVDAVVGEQRKCRHLAKQDHAGVAGTDKVAVGRHWDEHRR